MRFKKIYIEINNTCNFNCSFCIHTNRKKEFMSIENFSHIISQINDYTDYVYLHIMGEPLLHPKLNEFITICKNHNINVNITTNGSLLKKNREIFLNNPIRQLNISLHSIEKEDQIFYDYIDDVLSFVKELNDKTNTYISLRMWNVENENNSRQNYILNKISNDFNCLVNDIELKNYKNIKIKDHLFISLDRRFIWPSLNNEIYSHHGKCLGMKNMCGILVDGTVVPCCLDAQGDICLGNIFQTSFKDILESQKVSEILQGWKDHKCIEELCQKCSYRNRFDD